MGAYEKAVEVYREKTNEQYKVNQANSSKWSNNRGNSRGGARGNANHRDDSRNVRGNSNSSRSRGRGNQRGGHRGNSNGYQDNQNYGRRPTDLSRVTCHFCKMQGHTYQFCRRFQRAQQAEKVRQVQISGQEDQQEKEATDDQQTDQQGYEEPSGYWIDGEWQADE
jgi:hypothetical protein